MPSILIGMNTVLSLFGVDPFRIGGVEIFARECSRQLGEAGWRNVLVFEKMPLPEVREFLTLPNVHIECLDQLHRGRPDALSATWQWMKQHQPRVLHLHFVTFLSLYPWLGKAAGAEKVFFTDQGSWPEGHVIRPAPAWKRMIGRPLVSPITKVLNISDFGRRAASGHGYLPADRYTVIYNSVDLGRLNRSPEIGRQFRRKHGIPDDREVVLQMSWIIPDKGIDDLLAAARIVVARNPRAHFVFAGEGAGRPDYMAQCEKMGLAGHVTWTGLVKDPMQEGVFETADVFCLMSRWEEGFGWVLAEAMAHAKPVVATAVGAIPEVVEDQITGYVVPRRNPHLMADRILQLLDSGDLRQRMGEAGYQAVQTKFHLQRNVRKLLDLYGA